MAKIILTDYHLNVQLKKGFSSPFEHVSTSFVTFFTNFSPYSSLDAVTPAKPAPQLLAALPGMMSSDRDICC